MAKIKLLRKLWNNNAGDEMEVNEHFAAFAIRKQYAKPVPEVIEPKKAESADYKNKLDPEIKKLKNKRHAN